MRQRKLIFVNDVTGKTHISCTKRGMHELPRHVRRIFEDHGAVTRAIEMNMSHADNSSAMLAVNGYEVMLVIRRVKR